MSVDLEQPKAYDDIINLFVSGSAPEEIIHFKPSEESQNRVSELLNKSKSKSLTPEEDAELDDYGHIEHLMRLVKMRAKHKLNQ